MNAMRCDQTFVSSHIFTLVPLRAKTAWLDRLQGVGGCGLQESIPIGGSKKTIHHKYQTWVFPSAHKAGPSINVQP